LQRENEKVVPELAGASVFRWHDRTVLGVAGLGKKMEKKRAELPPARAGILSFWDEEAPGIKIDPDYILYACFAVAVLLIIAHTMAAV